MSPEQLNRLIENIESSSYELTPYSEGVISSVKLYGTASPFQEDYIIDLHNTLCTMNKEWLYPPRKSGVLPQSKSSDPLDAVMPTGKYKGKPIREILASDPSYIWWAFDKKIISLPDDVSAKLKKVFKR